MPFWMSGTTAFSALRTVLLRGLDVEVTLDSNGFTGEGDIHLFGELLNRFSPCMPT